MLSSSISRLWSCCAVSCTGGGGSSPPATGATTQATRARPTSQETGRLAAPGMIPSPGFDPVVSQSALVRLAPDAQAEAVQVDVLALLALAQPAAVEADAQEAPGAERLAV